MLSPERKEAGGGQDFFDGEAAGEDYEGGAAAGEDGLGVGSQEVVGGDVAVEDRHFRTEKNGVVRTFCLRTLGDVLSDPVGTEWVYVFGLVLPGRAATPPPIWPRQCSHSAGAGKPDNIPPLPRSCFKRQLSTYRS